MNRFDLMMAEADLLTYKKNDFENHHEGSNQDPLYLEYAFENVRRRTDLEKVDLNKLEELYFKNV